VSCGNEDHHAVTADDPFGELWPPSSADTWHVVRRINGFTVWRAIPITPGKEKPGVVGARARYERMYAMQTYNSAPGNAAPEQ